MVKYWLRKSGTKKNNKNKTNNSVKLPPKTLVTYKLTNILCPCNKCSQNSLTIPVSKYLLHTITNCISLNQWLNTLKLIVGIHILSIPYTAFNSVTKRKPIGSDDAWTWKLFFQMVKIPDKGVKITSYIFKNVATLPSGSMYWKSLSRMLRAALYWRKW